MTVFLKFYCTLNSSPAPQSSLIGQGGEDLQPVPLHSVAGPRSANVGQTHPGNDQAGQGIPRRRRSTDCCALQVSNFAIFRLEFFPLCLDIEMRIDESRWREAGLAYLPVNVIFLVNWSGVINLYKSLKSYWKLGNYDKKLEVCHLLREMECRVGWGSYGILGREGNCQGVPKRQETHQLWYTAGDHDLCQF